MHCDVLTFAANKSLLPHDFRTILPINIYVLQPNCTFSVIPFLQISWGALFISALTVKWKMGSLFWIRQFADSLQISGSWQLCPNNEKNRYFLNQKKGKCMNFKYLVTLVNSTIPLFFSINREKSQQGFHLRRNHTVKITASFRICEIFSWRGSVHAQLRGFILLCSYTNSSLICYR